MKKRFLSFILGFSLLCFMPSTIFATGYPVFDVSTWLATLDELYNTYDMITNTISQIENQYKMIEQNIERAKSIDWDNITFDGDFDVRNDIRNANKRVNKLLSCGNNIKKTITTPSINVGNTKWSIADLCGMSDPDGNGERRNITVAIGDYSGYIKEHTVDAIHKNFTEGLTEQQKVAIWQKYGISPTNYYFITTAHNEVLKGASNVLANAASFAQEGKLEAQLLRNSDILRAAAETTDSEGNKTETGLLEAMLYLFDQMSAQLVQLENAMYDSASFSASKVIDDNAREEARKADEIAVEKMNKKKNETLNPTQR